MIVGDIMAQPAISVAAGEKVDAIARILVDNAISGVPVVNEAGKVVGVVTEADLIVRNAELHFPTFVQILDARLYLQSPRHFEEELRRMLGTTAVDVMTAPPSTIGPDDSLERAATLMVEKKVNPLPVVDKAGKLVGVLSRSDIVRLMAKEGERQGE